MLSSTANGTDWVPANVNTDAQNLSVSSTALSITLGNSVNLSSLQDGTGTDNQTITALTLNASNVVSVAIEDGNTRTLNLSSLRDGDAWELVEKILLVMLK